MKTYVLHYTPLIERRKHIENEMKRENIPFEFVFQYDRENLTDAEHALFSGDISNSEKSLVMKHIITLYNIIRENHPYALVLEDDVILDRDFNEKLAYYISLLPPDWDMIFIGNGCNLHIPQNEQQPGVFIYKKSTSYPGATRCTDSILISQKCARAIFNYLQMPGYKITQAIDWLYNEVLHALNMNVYWTEPTIVSQGSESNMFKSSIHHTPSPKT